MFGHVQSRSIDEPIKKMESWSSRDLKRGRWRLEMTWSLRTGVENNMKNLDLQIQKVENHNEGRKRIHVDVYLNW